VFSQGPGRVSYMADSVALWQVFVLVRLSSTLTIIPPMHLTHLQINNTLDQIDTVPSPESCSHGSAFSDVEKQWEE
jgi:hypothetical protein